MNPGREGMLTGKPSNDIALNIRDLQATKSRKIDALKFSWSFRDSVSP